MPMPNCRELSESAPERLSSHPDRDHASLKVSGSQISGSELLSYPQDLSYCRNALPLNLKNKIM